MKEPKAKGTQVRIFQSKIISNSFNIRSYTSVVSSQACPRTPWIMGKASATALYPHIYRPLLELW